MVTEDKPAASGAQYVGNGIVVCVSRELAFDLFEDALSSTDVSIEKFSRLEQRPMTSPSLAHGLRVRFSIQM
jgi:hypothetical protein